MTFSQILEGMHRKDKGASASEIKLIEQKISFKLPADYKDFLTLANGAVGPIGKNSYLDLWSLSEAVEANEAYEINRLAADLFAFSSTGGGEGFAFNKGLETGIVQFPFADLNPDARILISRSFSDFLLHYEDRKFVPIE